MKTIFNTNVKIKSEKQYNRLKNAIAKKGLIAYSGLYDFYDINFHYNPSAEAFDAWAVNIVEHTVSEKEFLELLKQHQCTE